NILARIYGKQTQIKAGSYELRDGATPWTLLQKITQGDFQMTEMVFIEGWNFGQMRAALDGHAHVRHDTRDMTDGEIMARLGAPGVPPEGMFFPDTYLFAKGESDLAILARAHRLMNKELESAWESRAPDLPLSSAREALVLASIVEKETGDAKERPLIAGVFVNRLRRGMRLQTDPTVIYGMGERFDGNLRRKDLESDTPFNTYTREGLPPHPIAMPGRAALRAVVSPTQTDALYFVSKGDGTHQFSRSIDDHNRAVARYQKAATRK
ncbi:MAG: aminodeoxychorismate lyase, partial [Betaproteobacteria bacterium RIFCSPLOWO2_02_FULL_65_24]